MAAHPIPQPHLSPRDLSTYLGVLKKGIFLLSGTKDRPMLSGLPQLFAIQYILGETMGKSRRRGSAPPEWSRPLTLAAIALQCGAEKDRIATDLADAERRGLIESLSPARAKKLGLPPDGSSQAKRYRCHPDRWATAKPYEAPKISIVPKRARVEVDEEDEDDDIRTGTVAMASLSARADRAERAGHTRPTRVTMTIEPGQQVRPQLGPASEYRVQELCSFPLELDARNEHGVLSFSIRQGAKSGARQIAEVQPNQPVKNLTVGRSSYGQKPSHSDRRARLIAELADRTLPVTPQFAVSLEGKLGACELEFFLAELDSRLKRSTKITAALLPHLIDEAVAKWKVMEPVNRRFREEIARAEHRAAEIEAERQAYWDSPEGRAALADHERSQAAAAARQARIAACTTCKGKGTVTETYRPSAGSIDTKKRNVPCECAREQ